MVFETLEYLLESQLRIGVIIGLFVGFFLAKLMDYLIKRFLHSYKTNNRKNKVVKRIKPL